LRVEAVVQQPTNRLNRLLIIGHSLGGLAVLNALQPVWLQRLQSGTSGDGGLGSLVLLVNPAIEARRVADLLAAVRQTAPQHRMNDRLRPLLVIAGSEADRITQTAFTWSRAVPAWFESLFDPIAEEDRLGATQWDLAATAIGHFRQLFTHRLELAAAGSTSSSYSCPPVSYPSGGPVSWRMDDGLQLRELANGAVNMPPLWVVQTDRNVLPNHGFMTQQAFWCFIEQAMNPTASIGSL